jgi:hypothetical protein
MTTRTDLIDTYLAAYGEPDTDARTALIASAFTTDAVLADPPFAATGHAELHATFGAVQAQFPGHRFTRTSAVDEHHDTARYTWSLDGPDGTPAVAGMDVVSFASGGVDGVDGAGDRIARVVGFFGDVPAR